MKTHEQKMNSLFTKVQILISDIEKQIAAEDRADLIRILYKLQAQIIQEGNINFQGYSSAIYRIVTDDASFERSEIGQKLLRFIKYLHQFQD